MKKKQLTKRFVCGRIFFAVNLFYYERMVLPIEKERLMGQKIKQLRLEKKMTQAELAEDIVTRNMLSQIENGVAKPSVSTIQEIAKKLGVPTEYFFSDSHDLGAFRKLAVFPRIKKLFLAGEYGKCLTKLENLGVSDDETELLFAKCHLSLGIAKYHAGYLSSAAAHLKAAVVHTEKTLYADSAMAEVAEKYLSAITYIRAGEMPEGSPSLCGGQTVFADLAYIGFLSGVGVHLPEEGLVSGYAAHLAIRRKMQMEGCPDASDELRALLKTSEGQTDAILRYYILEDLEKLAKHNGDYKGAYECSAERLSLAEKMNQ